MTSTETKRNSPCTNDVRRLMLLSNSPYNRATEELTSRREYPVFQQSSKNGGSAQGALEVAGDAQFHRATYCSKCIIVNSLGFSLGIHSP